MCTQCNFIHMNEFECEKYFADIVTRIHIDIIYIKHIEKHFPMG